MKWQSFSKKFKKCQFLSFPNFPRFSRFFEFLWGCHATQRAASVSRGGCAHLHAAAVRLCRHGRAAADELGVVRCAAPVGEQRPPRAAAEAHWRLRVRRRRDTRRAAVVARGGRSRFRRSRRRAGGRRPRRAQPPREVRRAAERGAEQQPGAGAGAWGGSRASRPRRSPPFFSAGPDALRSRARLRTRCTRYWRRWTARR